MADWRFKCGTLARPGDRLTHPGCPGAVLILEGVGGYEGSWTTMFSVEINGVHHHGGSCMGCEKYTREDFAHSRLHFWLPREEPEPVPEAVVGEEVMW